MEAAPQIPTRVRLVASPLAERERNKVRGIRAEEYDFENIQGGGPEPNPHPPLSLMKGEATRARPAHSICFDAGIG